MCKVVNLDDFRGKNSAKKVEADTATVTPTNLAATIKKFPQKGESWLDSFSKERIEELEDAGAFNIFDDDIY